MARFCPLRMTTFITRINPSRGTCAWCWVCPRCWASSGSDLMIVMLALLNDGAILSIAYDNVHYKDKPESWNMRMVLGVSTVLGVIGVRSDDRDAGVAQRWRDFVHCV